jgi:hypothetical protein
MKKRKLDRTDDEDIDADDEEDLELQRAFEETEAMFNSDNEDLSEWKPVDFRVAKNVKNVYSLRIGAAELDELVDAAEAAGVNLSAFIREAALNEARRRKAGKSAVDEVRKKAKELAEAVSKL